MARDGPTAAEDRPEQDGARKQRLAALRIRLEEAAGDVRRGGGLGTVPARCCTAAE